MVVRHGFTFVNFQSYCLLSQRKGINRVWKGMWVAIVSEIWNLRNKVVFIGGLEDAEEIFCLAQLKVWLWFKFKLKRTTFSYSD